MSDSEHMLRVEGLSVAYDGVPALENVDLDVNRGRITALVGSNGAGKTTLMKTVAGLLRPGAGRVRFDGQDVTGWTPDRLVRRGLTLVPEGRRLFGSMSVRDNLRCGAYARDDEAAVRRDLNKVLEHFPILRERMNLPAGSLSGGQQQMLAVARALMAAPRLLMLDEPSIGLAPTVVQTIGKIILDISREGVDILLVEQNAQMALELSETAYVLENGAIVLQGPSAELLESDRVREAYLGL
ncbi:MAG: ABC transporter ATP-binding protein [Pseudomonadota bacterium]